MLRVGQIISNILSNAVKYGNGEIYINAYTSADSYYLIIEDNGEGIHNPHIGTELFLTEGDGGTGIGLYFANMLAQELRITISIEQPKELHGASFCIHGMIVKDIIDENTHS